MNYRCSVYVVCLMQAMMVGVWRVVEATATLKLQMIRYENPESKNYDGSCCDVFCWSQCDHVFRFALDRGNRCVRLMPDSHPRAPTLDSTRLFSRVGSGGVNRALTLYMYCTKLPKW